MAYIEPRKNKNGEIIAYRIRVNKGYDKNGKKLKPYEFTFKPDPEKSARQNAKALNEAAVEFEKKCRQGYIADCKQTFAEYAEYVIALKQRTGVRRRTIDGCFNHIDPVSISHRLGHSRVSTTTDYYSHMFKDADDINAETIADIVLRGGKNKAG